MFLGQVTGVRLTCSTSFWSRLSQFAEASIASHVCDTASVNFRVSVIVSANR